MPAYAVLNELSFAPTAGGGFAEDRELVRRLARTMHALRSAVTAHDRSSVVFVSPSSLGSRTLPGGATFLGALSALPNDALATMLLLMVSEEWFDDGGQATWRLGATAAHGLGEAHGRQGLAISFDVAPWQVSVLQIQRDEAGVVTTGDVANAWCDGLEGVHRRVLGRHVAVLPEYDNPGHHDPSSAHYVAGKSRLPRNARRVLDQAIPSAGQAGTWWAKCEHGFFHRFSGSVRGHRYVVHWNATTNTNAAQPTREDDVPSAVRKRLDGLGPVRDCGCVELGR